ncbi:hypothetical protein CRUP_015062, partial [Coryphaenoides rupestris]
MADAAGVAKELRALLRESLPRLCCSPVHLGLHPASPPLPASDKARAQLGALGLRLGDRVVIAGQKRRERASPGPKGTPPPRLPPSSTATNPPRTGPRSRTPSASSSVFEGPDVRLGERVLVVGQRTGVVQFYGLTSFAPGEKTTSLRS